jgi:membrane protease YdiL (CAAX protease family)
VNLARPAHALPALSFLPKPILEARRPWLAVLVGWLTATIPSLLLSAVVATLLPSLDQPEFNLPPIAALVAIVILSPLIETLIMAAILSLLLRFVPPIAAILISAGGWAITHSLQAAAWGLVIWWPFLIFSTLYVVWRQRSLALGIAIPAMVHALNNLGPALLIAAGLAK